MKKVSLNEQKANAPVGLFIGFLGGMAAYYLTHSSQGRKLRDQLLSIYDNYANTKDQGPSVSRFHAPTPSVVDILDQPLILEQSRYAVSLLKRVKTKLLRSKALSTTPPEVKPVTKREKTTAKRYFVKKKK